PPGIFVHVRQDLLEQWVQDYQNDPIFKARWNAADTSQDSWSASQRYFKTDDGMMYFRDADFIPRLCVPLGQRGFILSQAHDSALETAHAG
ncbi:hypothetical protein PENSPDRAFT_540876, partial [Peniophora sp. CONT]